MRDTNLIVLQASFDKEVTLSTVKKWTVTSVVRYIIGKVH